MTIYTIGDLCRLLSDRHQQDVPHWRMRRAVDDAVPDAPRSGQNRVILEDQVPLIERELIRRGWLERKIVSAK